MSQQYSEWLNEGCFYQRSNGQKIFCRHSGEGGQNVLFLHGFPTSSFDWSSVFSALRGRASLTAFDFLGFGASDKPGNHKYNYQEQSDIATEVAGYFNIDSCILLAHDYGVTVAQELLRRNDARLLKFNIEKVIFLNGGIFHELHRPTPAQKLLLTPILGALIARLMTLPRFEKAISAIFTGTYKLSRDEATELWQGITKNDGQNISHKLLHYIAERKQHGTAWESAMIKTEVPKLLLWGMLDPVSGKHMLDYAKTVLKGVETIELPDVSHYPQIEAPDIVSQAVLTALDDALLSPE